MVRGPYLICSVYYSRGLDIYSRYLEGLNMLEKSGNFAHASELVEMYVLYGFQE